MSVIEQYAREMTERAVCHMVQSVQSMQSGASVTWSELQAGGTSAQWVPAMSVPEFL